MQTLDKVKKQCGVVVMKMVRYLSSNLNGHKNLYNQGKVLWWILVSLFHCDLIEHVLRSSPIQILLTAKSQNLRLVPCTLISRNVQNHGRFEMHMFCMMVTGFSKVAYHPPRIS